MTPVPARSEQFGHEHPAVIACEELGVQSFASARVVPLKSGDCDASVFRLVDDAAGSAPIIAKRCPRATGVVERCVYQDVLGGVDVPAAPYYGWGAAKEDGFCWIFLGEVEGAKYSPRRREHRQAAAAWFAALHEGLRSTEAPPGLPDRAPSHYRGLLTLARAGLAHASFEGASGGGEHAVLDALARQLDRIADGWGEVEAACEGMPPSLVHGDFVAHNAYVREGAAGPVLIPIDWEKAGWGTPAEDLSEVDLDLYRSMRRPRPEGSWRERYARLARVGRTFRCLVFLEWAMPRAGGPWTGLVLARLKLCRSWLDDLG